MFEGVLTDARGERGVQRRSECGGSHCRSNGMVQIRGYRVGSTRHAWNLYHLGIDGGVDMLCEAGPVHQERRVRARRPRKPILTSASSEFPPSRSSASTVIYPYTHMIPEPVAALLELCFTVAQTFLPVAISFLVFLPSYPCQGMLSARWRTGQVSSFQQHPLATDKLAPRADQSLASCSRRKSLVWSCTPCCHRRPSRSVILLYEPVHLFCSYCEMSRKYPPHAMHISANAPFGTAKALNRQQLTLSPCQEISSMVKITYWWT